jgi:L-alanine-DL-glutamate epimerase-like enolase superfamily enzyme
MTGPATTDTLIDVSIERWPIAGTFTISRGSRTEAVVVVATVGDGQHQGQGEAVPYARYGETVEGVVSAIRAAADDGALSRASLTRRLAAGAARNALDCALLDLEAKRAGTSAAALLGIAPSIAPRETCFTLSVAEPAAMAKAAIAAADKPLLKLKLAGGALEAERLRAVRAGRPDARLVADANEAWSESDLIPLLAVAEVGLELVEQPLPAGRDAILADIPRPVPVCADESAHTAADIPALLGRYDAVNVKLDKAGGLTAALAMAEAARAAGLRVMAGCMVATSLAMAPAWLLSSHADWLDLDGPLLLAKDRPNGIRYARGWMSPPTSELWG